MFRFVVSSKTIAGLKAELQRAVTEFGDQNADEYISQDEDDGQLPLAPFRGPPPTAQDFADAMHAGSITGIEKTAANLGNEADHRGIKWDGRIHSDSKSINKDGTWRTRRGVEPSLVKQLEAEQSAPASVAQVAVPPVPPPAPPAALFPPQQPVMLPPTPVAPPPPAPAPPPIPTQQVTLAHSSATFRANMIPVMAHLVREAKLTPEYVQALKHYFKVDEIWLVSDQQAEEMFDGFVKAGLLTRVG